MKVSEIGVPIGITMSEMRILAVDLLLGGGGLDAMTATLLDESAPVSPLTTLYAEDQLSPHRGTQGDLSRSDPL